MKSSGSLANVSVNSGWTKEETEILKICLIKFGLGRWTKLEKSNCLPSKNTQQCYLQCQRMMGQQSLAEFLGLHLDIDAIAKKNKAAKGVSRKMGMIINTGDKLTPEEKASKQREN